MAKPSPVPKSVVCSVCDLPWEDHAKGRKTAPTADVCIRLLKAKLTTRVVYPFTMAGTAGSSIAQNVTSISAAQ